MALIAVVWVATLPATAHETDEDGETYTVLQDGECVTIAPFGDEDETVTEFYDYRTLHEDNPYHNTTGGSYSSEGTTALQRANASVLFLYEDRENDDLSLVFVHGATDESQSGAVTFTVGGLPEEAEWAVKDDKYDAEGNYDDWTREDERVRIDWTWKANRTDGGAYEGLGEEFTVTVDPAFNEDAELYGQQGEGTVENWMALSHVDEDHEDHESTYLDLTEPVVVSTESCEDLETATDELPDGDTAGGDGDADDPDGNDKEDESDDGDDED